MNLKKDKAAIICDNFGYVGKIEDINSKLNPKFMTYSSGSMVWRKQRFNNECHRNKISGYAICRDNNKVNIFKHNSIFMMNLCDIVEFYMPYQQNLIQPFIDNYKLYKDTIEYIIKKTDCKKTLYEPSTHPYNFNSIVMGYIPVEQILGDRRHFEAGYDTMSQGILYTVDAIIFDSAFHYTYERLNKKDMLPKRIIELKDTEIRFTENSSIF